MRKNRILCLLLTFCLCISLCVPALAAGTTLQITAPDTLPAAGESFAVTLDISGNPGFHALQFTMTYDRSVVECVKLSGGDMLEDALLAVNAKAPDGARLAAASTEGCAGDGEVATFRFKVLRDGDPRFALQDIVLSGEKGDAIAYTVKTVTGETSGGTTTDKPTQPPAQPEQNDPPKQEEPEQEDPKPEDTETPTEGGTEETVELPQTFTDVPDSYWASAQIERAAALGLISGYADGSFRPGNQVTRAQFVTMLWRMAGKPAASKTAAFRDTAALNADFKSAIAWASENGYVNGVTADTFSPNATITRQQAMVILFRYSGGVSGLEMMLSGTYDSQFTDSGSIGAFARSGVYWAVYNGIVTGTSTTTISPQGTATRAQIAVILLRYMDKFQR